MTTPDSYESDPNERMKSYLEKIASGPEMSKDLTESEAEDGLSIVLSGEVSSARAAVFLIASRMKRETLEENRGFWKALNRTTVRRPVALDALLQIADPFDGFNRTSYFGFYAIPVLAEAGLACYGHSCLTLPPKFGITFEEILRNHYQWSAEGNFDQRVRLLEEFRFGYLDLTHTNPALEKLRELRVETVKRSTLATFEKMLMPLQAKKNFLATGYFHPGYEIPMLEVARLSDFDSTVMGNGQEGTTLYGVHKAAGSKLFIDSKHRPQRSIEWNPDSMYNVKTADSLRNAFAELKSQTPQLASLADQGEHALKGGGGPSAILIAHQAASLGNLFGLFDSPQQGYEAVQSHIQSGRVYEKLMRFLDAGNA